MMSQPVCGGHEGLGPVLHPLERETETLRQGSRDVVFAVDIDLAAEAATNFRGYGPHLVFAKAQHLRDV